jgi:hypothetical protein
MKQVAKAPVAHWSLVRLIFDSEDQLICSSEMSVHIRTTRRISKENSFLFVRFEVFTAVALKNVVFLDVNAVWLL